MKKDDLPYMPFYVGDWLKAPDVQSMSYEMQGIWIKIMCYMWESNERGYLKYSMDELERLLGIPEILLQQKLQILINKGICSVRSDGAIYSRRMAKSQELREKRAISGQKGGKTTSRQYFAKPNTKANAIATSENEIENEIICVSNKLVKAIKPKTPTLEEIKQYCSDRKSSVDPEYFFHHYEQSNWVKPNGQKVVNWKSTIITWERRNAKQTDKEKEERWNKL